MLTPAEIEAARARIGRFLRPTRLIRVTRAPEHPWDLPVLDARIDRPLWLKLECEQVSGSFKARGALNCVLSLDPDTRARGIVTASGGNHGLAVAYAGRVAGARTVVYLPGRASADKAARIAQWGAEVVRAGDVWDDAHAAALARAAIDGSTYIHPFADRTVMCGQATIPAEVPDADLFVVAIGGGGLICGIAEGAPRARVLGVEPVGAPTLQRSVLANAVIELESIDTAAGTLAPRKSDAQNLAIIQERVERIVLVTDDEMRDAARFLLREIGVGVELAGAAALAAVLSGRADLGDAKSPCILVCGAGSDALG